MKILQVVSCLERGGTEAFIMNCYRKIDRTQFDFDFLVFINKKSPYEKEIRTLGGKIIYADVLPSFKHAFHFIAVLKGIMIENGPYDAVHVHLNATNSLVIIAAKLAGINKRISHAHTTNSSVKISNWKKTYYTFLSLVNNMLSTSQLACSKEAGKYIFGNSKKVLIIKNGIELQPFIEEDKSHVESLRKEFKIKTTDIIYGNITRFDYNKNQSFIIDIFFEILKQQQNALLLLGGIDGGILNEIYDKIKALKIENRVRIIGVRADVPSCLKLIKCYLFPSKYEGLGIVLLETQASKIPALVSNCIPRDVDLGLGLINFLSLNDSPSEWANHALNIRNPVLSVYDVTNRFLINGYNIHQSVLELENVYKKEIYN